MSLKSRQEEVQNLSDEDFIEKLQQEGFVPHGLGKIYEARIKILQGEQYVRAMQILQNANRDSTSGRYGKDPEETD